MAGGLSGCGSGSLTGLTVVTRVITQGSPATSATVAQGTAAQIQVTVTNTGGGSLKGVTVRIDVPSDLTYTSTVSVVENGTAVRSADVAPTSRAAIVTWGAWTIGSGVPGQASQVVLTANLVATAGSGTVEVAPEVFASGYDTPLSGTPVKLTLAPAPSLSLSLRASPTAIAAGGEITYRAEITNTGSGSAPDTSLGITLPSDFDYEGTVSTSGNASTSGASYPIVGSVIPTWSGFDVPGQNSGGPGVLEISFQVQVLSDVGRGIYQATATVVASNGSSDENDIELNYDSLAPVEVTGPGTTAG